MISVKQRFTMLARLGEHIDWDKFTTKQVQVGITEAQRAGAEATAFIQNGFRMHVGDFFRQTGELTIQIPALARPTLAELGEKNGIRRDTSPTEAVTLKLGTVLGPDEKPLNGAEYEQRIAPKLNICLGYQQAQWLVEHQEEFPEFMALLGKVYIIYFPGLVVVDASGDRFTCLDKFGERWGIVWSWLGNGFDRGGRIAVYDK